VWPASCSLTLCAYNWHISVMALDGAVVNLDGTKCGCHVVGKGGGCCIWEVTPAGLVEIYAHFWEYCCFHSEIR
jgi:hypothetical protein